MGSQKRCEGYHLVLLSYGSLSTQVHASVRGGPTTSEVWPVWQLSWKPMTQSSAPKACRGTMTMAKNKAARTYRLRALTKTRIVTKSAENMRQTTVLLR